MANVSLLRWKEYGDTDAPSLRERFEPGPYPGQEKIVRYLENGKVILAAPGISRDVFTGELIAVRLEVLTDGAYSWDTALSTFRGGFFIQSYL